MSVNLGLFKGKSRARACAGQVMLSSGMSVNLGLFKGKSRARACAGQVMLNQTQKILRKGV